MNLTQLKMFVTVVEKQGFSSAARHLNLSPTAVSKQIKALEDGLGIQLIYRTSTKFEITDVGEMFYTHCKRLLKDMDNLEDMVQSFQNEPRGNLSVFSTTAFADIYIIPYLKEFTSLYPKVLITLDVADRIPDVQKEGIDLCFGLIRHWDNDLIQKKLFTSRPNIYAAPSYLKVHDEPKSIKELQDHKFICHGNRPDNLMITLKGGASILVTPSLVINAHEAFISAALQGLGLIVLFDFTARDHVEKGQLVQLLTGEEMESENYYVHYLATQHPKPAAKALLDFIISKI
jgi:DNA-binding transcriptional LysR family regulator